MRSDDAALEAVGRARRRAQEMAGDQPLHGPLQGYHHETYVFPLPGGTRRVKFRELRDGLLWFDRRCFVSEEDLLRTLKGRIASIPDIFDVGGMGLQGFIEGRTLGRSLLWNAHVPDVVFDQIVDLFQEMVRIPPDMLDVRRRCLPEDRPYDGDTDGFLHRLIAFMEERVYRSNLWHAGRLFKDLNVNSESFRYLRKHVSGLTERPFCLLHGDLHRENFVVDREGRLWTIDWELAQLGDPLYDLATHLYLMRYPADQERDMITEWCRVVEGVRPGSSHGWASDLPVLLDFKRAQSVFTDVIRTSMSLSAGPKFNWTLLPGATRKLQKVLVAGAEPLGLEEVPTPARIMAALVRRHRVMNLEFA
ncbi:phosphotransferase [Streptomyces sp. DG2A-72]|uniref:phosphotransferase n=1 Tax=Streptomyces sp. DG2A-72 TaxID=3051386 RepID=UPI00265C70AD|nr:phosphotransferase [Streptomyces sp. DG2A-72]MDO0934247.1 phosphotransferase [Streptomyces sp. DG2A-72]